MSVFENLKAQVVRESISAEGLLVEFRDGHTRLYSHVHPLISNPRAAERLGVTVALVHLVSAVPPIPLLCYVLGNRGGEHNARCELRRYLEEVKGFDTNTSLQVNIGYFNGETQLL